MWCLKTFQIIMHIPGFSLKISSLNPYISQTVLISSILPLCQTPCQRMCTDLCFRIYGPCYRLNCVHKNSYVEVLTQYLRTWTSFGSRVVVMQWIKMWSNWIRMGPSSKMKVILRQGENLNKDMHTELMPCEDKGRDWSDASTKNTKCWLEMTRNSGRGMEQILPNSP